MNMKLRYVFSVTILLFAAISLKAQKKSNQTDLLKWVNNLKGNYSNAKQVKADSSYQKANLLINPIWPNYRNSQWVYIELTTKSNAYDSCLKYLYQVFKVNDSLIIFQPYELPPHLNNQNFDKNNIEHVAADQIMQKIGCAIFLNKDKNGNYKGQTHAADCGSKLNGAFYETFYVNFSTNEINWWNSGYDSLGNYIWGNTKGGYIFNKINK